MSGQLKYDFVVSGLTKTTQDLKQFKSIAEQLQPSMLKNRKAQTQFIKAFQESNSTIANATKNQKYFKGALDATNKALSKSRNYLNGFKAGYASATAAIDKTRKSVADNSKCVKAAIPLWRRYAKAVHENASAHKGWWDSFGRVAIGFGIAYRLINLVENSIAQLTESFRGGITAMDQYKQSVATVSGMLSLLSTGGSYKDRFEAFSGVMNDTMRETLRIMPRYKLSIEEVSDAYKELAQFGVVVAKNEVKSTLTSIATIKEIAVTTGSSSRQIRQEIQSIFNGSTRISDQFGRFLKRFPELEQKLYGINKLTTSNAEKWKLATTVIDEYSLAILRANDTVGAQSEIIRNTLQILSMDSLKLTGIYDKWTKGLKAISESLISDTGDLGDLGKEVVRWFGMGWIAIENTRKALAGLVVTFRSYANIVSSSLGGFGEYIKQFAVFAVTIKIVVSTLKGLYKVLAVLWSPWLLLAGAMFTAYTAFEVWMDKGLRDTLRGIGEYVTSIYDTVVKLINKIINFDLPKYLEPKDKRTMSVVPTANGGWDIVWDEGPPKPQDKPKSFVDVPAAGDVFGAPDAAGPTGLSPTGMNSTKDFFGDVAAKMKGHISQLKELVLEFTTGMTGEDFTSLDFDMFNLDDAEAAVARLKALFGDITMQQAAQFEEIKKKSKHTWEYMADGFSSYFTTIISGEIKSFSDLWKLTLTSMRDTWAKAMSDMASDYINTFMRQIAVAQSAQGEGASFLGTLTKTVFAGAMRSFTAGDVNAEPWADSGLTSGITADSHMGLATGGIIPEPVVGVGASGRTYSFAEQGPERVLSNADSFGNNEPMSVRVEVINKSSQKVKGSQGATRIDFKGMVTQIILEDLATNGPMARGMA